MSLNYLLLLNSSIWWKNQVKNRFNLLKNFKKTYAPIFGSLRTVPKILFLLFGVGGTVQGSICHSGEFVACPYPLALGTLCPATQSIYRHPSTQPLKQQEFVKMMSWVMFSFSKKREKFKFKNLEFKKIVWKKSPESVLTWALGHSKNPGFREN